MIQRYIFLGFRCSLFSSKCLYSTFMLLYKFLTCLETCESRRLVVAVVLLSVLLLVFFILDKHYATIMSRRTTGEQRVAFFSRKRNCPQGTNVRVDRLSILV